MMSVNATAFNPPDLVERREGAEDDERQRLVDPGTLVTAIEPSQMMLVRFTNT